MSESEYVDRTPLDDPAWVIALVEERDALRARVAELEGAVLRAVNGLTAADFRRIADIEQEHPFAAPEVIAGYQRAALVAALLPAPAPGRDTAGPGTTAGSGTTTGGTDAA